MSDKYPPRTLPFDEVTLDLTLENGIITKVEEKDH